MPKPRSKEQIADGIKRVQEAKRMREFVKTKFYPALINASTSIEDAKFLLGGFSNMIMETFLAQMKEKKFIELKLHEKLDKKSPMYKQFVDMLSLFSDENVFTARELVEGMKNEVQMFIDTEMKERKLDTLKTNFLE
jgi:hypothetical protein